MALQVRRGTNSERLGVTFAPGELVYTTDSKGLYVGDGLTPGGVDVVSTSGISGANDVDLPTFIPTTVSTVESDGNGLVTLALDSPHGLMIGDKAELLLDGNAALNGQFEVSAVPTTETVVLNGPLIYVAPVSDTGTLRKLGYNITDGSFLSYSDASAEWGASTIQLDTLSDVDLTGITLLENDRLAYNAGTGNWEAIEGNLTSLTDVTLTSPANGEILKHNGTEFVNTVLDVNAIDDLTAVGASNGQALAWDEVGQTFRPTSFLQATSDIAADLYQGSENNGLDSFTDILYIYSEAPWPNTDDVRYGTGSMRNIEGRNSWRHTGEVALGQNQFTIAFWIKSDPMTYGSGLTTIGQLNYAPRSVFQVSQFAADVSGTPGAVKLDVALNRFTDQVNGILPGGIALWAENSFPGQGEFLVGTVNIPIDDGEWHHILIQREDLKQYAIFVDGVLDNRRSNVVGLNDWDFGTWNEWAVAGNAKNDTFINSTALYGFMDEFGLWAGVALFDGLNGFEPPNSGGSRYFYSGAGIGELADVVLGTPQSGDVLTYNGTVWASLPPGGALQDLSKANRGDPGDFTTGVSDIGYVTGIYGGGDFNTGTIDQPWEEIAPIDSFFDGGDFTA